MKDDSEKARGALQRAAKHAKAFDIRSEALLHDVLYVLHNAHQSPFSSHVKVDREELIGLVEEAIEVLPKELAEALKMIEEKESFLAQRDREAQEILDDVRAQAEHMVQRSELVREARRSAQHIIDEANAEAMKIRHDVDEYCDKRLAIFEASLDRIVRSVREGREKMVSLAVAGDSAKSSVDKTGVQSSERGHIRSASRSVSHTEEFGTLDGSSAGGTSPSVSVRGKPDSHPDMVGATGAPSNRELSGSTPKKNLSSSAADSEVAAGSTNDGHPRKHGVQPIKGKSTAEGSSKNRLTEKGGSGMDADEEDDSSRHFFDQDKA